MITREVTVAKKIESRRYSPGKELLNAADGSKRVTASGATMVLAECALKELGTQLDKEMKRHSRAREEFSPVSLARIWKCREIASYSPISESVQPIF